MYQRDRRKQGMQQYGFMGPKPLDPIQGISAPPAAAPQQGALSQFGDMAKQRLMTTALNKGTEQGTALLSSVFNPATTGAASGAMGALGTAMPYVGMGVLGAKMLGLFSKGGYVGPLSGVSYQSKGGKITANFYNK